MTLAISLIAIGATALIMMLIGTPARTTHLETAGFTNAEDGAIACAANRLAQGRITAEEYERIVSVLRS